MQILSNIIIKFQNEKINGSGKKRLISIIKPAVNENQAKATTGAVDKYVVKSFIKVNILKTQD